MQAIILAAGMGKRLRELTANVTKCMIKIGGMTLIERMLRQLERKQMSRVIVVIGYQGETLCQFIESLELSIPIVFVENKEYETTNNIYSLSMAKEYMLEEDTLLLESDSIFEEQVLDSILYHPYPNLALVARPESWMNGAAVTLDKNGNILNFISAQNFRYSDMKEYYKTVNIYKFSKKFAREQYVPLLAAYSHVWGHSSIYESALKVIAFQEKPVIKALVLEDEKWYEINDIQDIDIAESLFAQGTAKVKLYMRRFGGYWRYPKMLDYCYLVNPLFPNERFMDEMRANFETLIREYPSGQAVNSVLAGRYFGLRPENICVGNGTAELIKSLMEHTVLGKIGMVYPTFEEYPHRMKAEDVVPFPALSQDFTYDVDSLMKFYGEKEIAALILVNPDNPSGHFIPRTELIRLAQWARQKSCYLIVDESFVDFADTGVPNTLLEQHILDENPALIVLKSISKSFGVAGLRLGVIASANTQMIAFMKKDVAIWNINSFAEYYMQIIDKYKSDYEEAMQQFMEIRRRYVKNLKKVKNLHIFPSQANYVMCRIDAGCTSTQLADVMLNRYNILIKDLSTKEGLKGGNYIRLSVKTDEENEKMVAALREVLG